MSELLYLDQKQLRLHPQNIRLWYPDEEVREMAASIKAAGGVYQALLITPIPEEDGRFYVVDGNMRLMGGRELGAECPPLKCEVVTASVAEQLVIMAVTTERHYPKDMVSKGQHYKRLMEQEGMSVSEIAALMGCSTTMIYNCLRLLELDEPIRQLIVERKLSTSDPKVLALLMKIPDAERRLALAERFARHGSSGRTMREAIRHVIRQLNVVEQAEIELPKPRGAPYSVNGRNGHGPVQGAIDADMVVRMAETTLCDHCRLDGLTKECWVCPGPYEFVQAIVEKVEFETIKEVDRE